MRTVFYYCQTSSNIAAPDRAIGTMWRVGAFRQWTDVGTVKISLALRWSSALVTVTRSYYCPSYFKVLLHLLLCTTSWFQQLCVVL